MFLDIAKQYNTVLEQLLCYICVVVEPTVTRMLNIIKCLL